MRTRSYPLAVACAALLSLPACSADEPRRSTPMLQFADSSPESDSHFSPRERTSLHVKICVDGLAKPTHRAKVENPGFESVTFMVDATEQEVIVQPRAGVLRSGELLELSMELTPFVSRAGRRLVSVQRSDGEEMLSVSLDAVVDARLLEVTPVGWADAETFVVAIENPTGFIAADLFFQHEDGSASGFVGEVAPGETRRVVVDGAGGKPPPIGSRVTLHSLCSGSPLPDNHFFVRAPEE